LSELNILGRLANKHENIISLVGSKDESELESLKIHLASTDTPSPPRLLILLEFAGNGTMHSWTQANRSRIGKPLWCRWAKQLASAVAYIHHIGLIHHDIKPQNVLLNDFLDCKLADFGNAAFVGGEILTDGLGKGTLVYSAPELVTLGMIYSYPVDIYSVGVTLYTLCTLYLHSNHLVSGIEPFSLLSKTSAVQTLIAIRSGFFECGMNPGGGGVVGRNEWVFGGNSHEDQIPFLDIVRKCLRVDAGRRPSGEELGFMVEEAELEAACRRYKRSE
jgi:serine/threonine protein kinase